MPKVEFQPPFPYYGAKATIARWIVSQLPSHTQYIEPFFGSGAVLLAKPRCRVEVANDSYGEVVNFFRVLRDRPGELIQALRITPYARDEYLAARAPATESLERARRFFVGCNMGFNGKAHSGFSFSGPPVPAGTGKDRKPKAFTDRIDLRLAAIADRIRTVEFENIDALELMERWNRPDVVAYLDPPYPASTRADGRGYVHDSNTTEFHTALVEQIRDWRGTVVLSGYANPTYDTLGWRTVSQLRNAPTSNTAGATRVETLWINDDSGPSTLFT